MSYRVDVRTVSGWEDCWMEDEKPMRFDSKSDAQYEIDDHIADCEEAVLNDNMDEAPVLSDFKIVQTS